MLAFDIKSDFTITLKGDYVVLNFRTLMAPGVYKIECQKQIIFSVGDLSQVINGKTATLEINALPPLKWEFFVK